MKQSILSNVTSINSKRLAMNILGDPYVLKIANNLGVSLTGTVTRAFVKVSLKDDDIGCLIFLKPIRYKVYR